MIPWSRATTLKMKEPLTSITPRWTRSIRLIALCTLKGKTEEKCLKCSFTGHVNCSSIRSSTSIPPPPNFQLTSRGRLVAIQVKVQNVSKVWPNIKYGIFVRVTAVLTIITLLDFIHLQPTRRWSFE